MRDAPQVFFFNHLGLAYRADDSVYANIYLQLREDVFKTPFGSNREMWRVVTPFMKEMRVPVTYDMHPCIPTREYWEIGSKGAEKRGLLGKKVERLPEEKQIYLRGLERFARSEIEVLLKRMLKPSEIGSRPLDELVSKGVLCSAFIKQCQEAGIDELDLYAQGPLSK